MDIREVKVPLAVVASIVTFLFGIWFAAPMYFVPQAQAADQTKAIARRFLFEVQEQIANAELRKIEVKYNTEIPPQQKEETLAALDLKLAVLRRREECHAEGKIECD